MDFEAQWQEKLGDQIESRRGRKTRINLLAGGEQLGDQSRRDEVIEWTSQAIQRLEGELTVEAAEEILTQCACRYPHAALESLRKAYQARGDLEEIHRSLQRMFRAFLSDEIGLTAEQIDSILEKGWGLAGTLKPNRILATKIPKSGYLREYLAESDPQRRREMYCHCPRVRDAVKLGKTVPPTYCYCGAGFYQDLWQTILNEPVRVEVVSSVLKGDDVCTIAIFLP